MIKLEQAVIVEGKYDKITLENIIDATIIPTNGFGIFKDRQRCELIRRLAEEKGVVVITDSDSAGALIRSHLKNICANGKITNVYVPQLAGKERRKSRASKEGILGVEGLDSKTITEALERSGVMPTGTDVTTKKVCKIDLYQFGLSGCAYSSCLREQFAEFSNLPNGMSANAFLDAVNAVYSYDDLIKAVSKWQQEADKR